MQTYLPYADFARCADVLDRQRLGKQRVECLQVLNTLSGKRQGWRHHPAVKMWRGYEGCLVEYGLAICREWTSRGYRDTCADKIEQIREEMGWRDCITPPWLGDEAVHRSHRSNLLRKAPEHYGARFEAQLPDDLDYVWPTERDASQSA